MANFTSPSPQGILAEHEYEENQEEYYKKCNFLLFNDWICKKQKQKRTTMTSKRFMDVSQQGNTNFSLQKIFFLTGKELGEPNKGTPVLSELRAICAKTGKPVARASMHAIANCFAKCFCCNVVDYGQGTGPLGWSWRSSHSPSGMSHIPPRGVAVPKMAV